MFGPNWKKRYEKLKRLIINNYALNEQLLNDESRRRIYIQGRYEQTENLMYEINRIENEEN